MQGHNCDATDVFDCFSYTDCRVCLDPTTGKDKCVTVEEAKSYEQCVTSFTNTLETGGWAKQPPSVVHPEQTVSFSVSVKQQNLDTLFEAALAVSTPGNPRYGKFLSIAEIEALTAPAPADVAVIRGWLDSHGIVPEDLHRDILRVTTTAERAARALSTSFHRYHRQLDGRTIVRAGDYTLPAAVSNSVAAIFGLHGSPLPPREPLVRGGPNPGPGPEAAKVTPTVLAQTYRVADPYVDRAGKNRQAVAEFQGQYMNKDDLAKFFQSEVPSAQAGDDQIAAFKGVPYKEGTGVEAELDIEFIMGVAPGVKTEFWEWPDGDFCADLHNYSTALLAPGGPLVNSISYGWYDADPGVATLKPSRPTPTPTPKVPPPRLLPTPHPCAPGVWFLFRRAGRAI
jgi:subtilase family serine protease